MNIQIYLYYVPNEATVEMVGDPQFFDDKCWLTKDLDFIF